MEGSKGRQTVVTKTRGVKITLPKFINFYSLACLTGLTGSLDSRAGLLPSSFSASTRKLYVFPSNILFTLNDVVSGKILSSFVQFGRLSSRLSMMYPVRGLPPSDFGGFHDNTADLSVTSEMSSGPSGALGLSKEK